jgi:hypothetical protein
MLTGMKPEHWTPAKKQFWQNGASGKKALGMSAGTD